MSIVNDRDCSSGVVLRVPGCSGEYDSSDGADAIHDRAMIIAMRGFCTSMSKPATAIPAIRTIGSIMLISAGITVWAGLTVPP